MQEAPRFARCLLRLAVRVGDLRLSRIPSRGEGRLARWAWLDRGPLALDFWPRAQFDRRIERLHKCADIEHWRTCSLPS
eukprot:1793491-Alexandrium_andersonii.AAC.1